MGELCGCFLRMPDGSAVPCTLPYDHLERHRCVVRGITLLVWSREDNGEGYVVDGALACLFVNGTTPRWGELSG